MLLQLTTLQGLPVASLADEATIASVLDAVVHPETGELLGFWVQPHGLFARRKALASRDVVGYDPQAVVVQRTDVLVDAAEIKPFAKAAKEHPTWLGKRVETDNGHWLGTVSDLVINVDLEVLATLQVSSLFAAERLIAREAIVRVTPKAIVVAADAEVRATQPTQVQVASA